MPAYLYKAIDQQGKLCTGTTDAPNVETLTETLKARGVFLMESKIEKARSHVSGPATPAQRPNPLSKPMKIKRVPLGTLALFTSELNVMLRTALPIAEALHTLSRQQSHASFKQVLSEIYIDVQQGQSLSESFERFPTVFGPIYIALLRAGEASGTLPVMLERLTSYLNFQREMRSKVTTALLYPMIIIATGVGVVSLLVLFILPAFAAIFDQLHSELPAPTRALLALSTHLRSCWWVYFVLLGGAVWGFRLWLAKPGHRGTIERFELKLPIIGSLIRNIVLTRVLRTLGALVAGGVPILDSLQLAGEAASHTVFHDIMARVRQNASEGKGLATALSSDPNFPEAAAHMIANAELTGSLPEVMEQISHYYEQETDLSIQKLLTLLEPLFVVVLGLTVGLIAGSILWPMFHLEGGNL